MDEINVFAYYRISPTPRKNTPEMNQKKVVRQYCLEKNIKITQEFTDLLISGKENESTRI